MPKIVFKHGSDIAEVDAQNGETVLEAANRNGVKIFGGCRGAGVCGTCCVIIDSTRYDKLPPISDSEADILDALSDTDSSFRLACQVVVSDELDGAVIEIP
ncbi:MAG: 2Fe-2S iron-sulfur cluster binding domain-containing protein [Holosporales bacterium]|jgi:ferredoxin|nr:2Fe-2S iron-sulfur cluster binding domain-containing protein [Holosporales bacterium]